MNSWDCARRLRSSSVPVICRHICVYPRQIERMLCFDGPQEHLLLHDVKQEEKWKCLRWHRWPLGGVNLLTAKVQESFLSVGEGRCGWVNPQRWGAGGFTIIPLQSTCSPVKIMTLISHPALQLLALDLEGCTAVWPTGSSNTRFILQIVSFILISRSENNKPTISSVQTGYRVSSRDVWAQSKRPSY